MDSMVPHLATPAVLAPESASSALSGAVHEVYACCTTLEPSFLCFLLASPKTVAESFQTAEGILNQGQEFNERPRPQ